MRHFIDRRQNPKGKSLGNRQRFLRRTRHHLKQKVNQAIKQRSVRDLERGETVSVPTKPIDEPQFVLSRSTGKRQRILPGNKEFTVGDRFKRPSGGGQGRGREGAPDGEGEDEFSFALTKQEFLDILFEDLALPHLVKTDLMDVKTVRVRRAGYTTTGTQSNLSLRRTMRNAYGRRLALGRPSLSRLDRVRAEIEAIEAVEEEGGRDEAAQSALAALQAELARLEHRRRAIPYIDPMDVRYANRTPQEMPNTKAVMFCLMDVSSSMGEREKDLAKRFFILLHLFLERCYESTDIVFVRHTHFAQEVDEETFFYGRETGGTVVSTALKEMERIIAERYPTNNWNIYVAQASDGENLSRDSAECARHLHEHIMPLCQYFAYVEIVDSMMADRSDYAGPGHELWQAYDEVAQEWSNFQIRRVSGVRDIYPVFRELFAKRGYE